MQNVVYTDGGCHEGHGSWAYVKLDGIANIDNQPNRLAIDGGYVYDTTNNRMEMWAIINAVKSYPHGSSIRVYSDSGYCVNGHNHPSYLKKWLQNGWRTSKKQPVENQDLWMEIVDLDRYYDIQYILVKGHSKDKTSPHKYWNDMCDDMCTDYRLMAKGRFDTRGVRIPHTCPNDCRFTGQIMDQNGMCYNCPVMLCKDPEPLVPFNVYRCEWLVEWDKFFRGEIRTPILSLDNVEVI